MVFNMTKDAVWMIMSIHSEYVEYDHI